MKFNPARFFGLLMLLTMSLPGLWWRAAHPELLDTTKTMFLFWWTIFNIFLISWDYGKNRD